MAKQPTVIFTLVDNRVDAHQVLHGQADQAGNRRAARAEHTGVRGRRHIAIARAITHDHAGQLRIFNEPPDLLAQRFAQDLLRLLLELRVKLFAGFEIERGVGQQGLPGAGDNPGQADLQ